jgi:hypothetical protein
MHRDINPYADAVKRNAENRVGQEQDGEEEQTLIDVSEEIREYYSE